MRCRRDIVPRDEIIASPHVDAYKIPSFLQKTATDEQLECLRVIFEELQGINEEHVGENTKEVEAYLAVTDQYRPLAQRCSRWCEDYFSMRLQKGNTKDRGDAARTFNRLSEEYQRIFGHISRRDQSLDYIFIAESSSYFRWLLWAWSRVGVSVPVRLSELPISVQQNPATIQDPVEQVLYESKILPDNLAFVAASIAASVGKDCLEEFTRRSDDALHEELLYLADDIHAMRPFLVAEFDVAQSLIELPGQSPFFIAWDWCTQYGMANVHAHISLEMLQLGIKRNTSVYPVKIDHEGVMTDGSKPWIRTDNDERLLGINALAINTLVLDQFHKRLFSLYERIDFSKIRQRVDSDISFTEEPDFQALALTCQDLAAQDDDAEIEKTALKSRSRIATLRLNRLIQILQKLGCTVRGGKGSELVVRRPGFSEKAFRLGRHKTNPLIFPERVKALLKRLAITWNQWKEAVYE